MVDPDLTDRMSEWVVMHALAHLRQLRRYERQQRERVWADDKDQPKAAEVQVGVLGLGVLGKRRRSEAEGDGLQGRRLEREREVAARRRNAFLARTA